jgi:hypothetical protein
VGTSSASNLADVVNEPPFIVHSFALASHGHGLAWEPGGDDVNGVGVVDLCQVAEVRGVGVVVRHDAGGVGVDLGVPR